MRRLRRQSAPSWADPRKNETSERLELDKWVISDFVSEVLLPTVGTRPYPLDELVLMASAACALRPTHIFEWGTHHGKSARVFWETTERFSIPSKIISIDLPDDVHHEEHPGAGRGEYVRGKGRIELLQGDGLELALGRCRGLGTRSKPLFFLDGDHSYESVLRELSGITKEVPTAAILLHDTFYQSSDSGYNVGPHEAIGKVLSGSVRKRYERLDTILGLPGMTLLHPRGGGR